LPSAVLGGYPPPRFAKRSKNASALASAPGAIGPAVAWRTYRCRAHHFVVDGVAMEQSFAAAGSRLYARPLGTGEGDLVTVPWRPRHGHLRFAVEQDDDRVTVHLAGELDYASAATGHLALARAGARATEIVIDLSRVVFVDASGVRFLLSAQRRARAADRRLIIRQPSRSVRRMLELTGARPLLNVDDSGNGHPPTPGATQLAPILDAALEPAMRIARADRSTAHVVDPSTGARRLVAQRGFDTTVLDWLEIVCDSESVCPALAGEQPLWIPDLARSPILADTPALDALLDAGVRALASVPVKSLKAPLIAIVSVYHRVATDWTAGQRSELEQHARSLVPQCLEALRLHSHVAIARAL
jgi:anti-anti-sigma factor